MDVVDLHRLARAALDVAHNLAVELALLHGGLRVGLLALELLLQRYAEERVHQVGALVARLWRQLGYRGACTGVKLFG